MGAKDLRLKMMNEILNGIKVEYRIILKVTRNYGGVVA